MALGSLLSKLGLGKAKRAALAVGETVAGAKTGEVGYGAFLAAGGLSLGEGVVPPLTRLFKPPEPDLMLKASRREAQAVIGRGVQRVEIQRLQEQIAQNLATIAAVNPTLYSNLAAGRRIPRGAEVIGGPIREDLLELVGRALAEGRFQDQGGFLQ